MTGHKKVDLGVVSSGFSQGTVDRGGAHEVRAGAQSILQDEIVRFHQDVRKGNGKGERGFSGVSLVDRVAPGGEDSESVYLRRNKSLISSAEVAEHAGRPKYGIGNASQPRGASAGLVVDGCRHDELGSEIDRALE